MKAKAEDVMKRFTTPERMDEAHLGDYPRLDAGFYDDFERLLRGKGFRLLGDVCITTPGLTHALGRNTVYRCMCDASGTVMATAYQAGFTRWRRLAMRLAGLRCDKVVELRAATAEGDVFLVGNVEAAAFQRRTLAAAGVRYEQCPMTASPEALYECFRALITAAAADSVLSDRTLLRLDTIGLQKSIMEYEEEKAVQLARFGLMITPEEFAQCVNIYFEASRLTVGGLDKLLQPKD